MSLGSPLTADGTGFERAQHSHSRKGVLENTDVLRTLQRMLSLSQKDGPSALKPYGCKEPGQGGGGSQEGSVISGLVSNGRHGLNCHVAHFRPCEDAALPRSLILRIKLRSLDHCTATCGVKALHCSVMLGAVNQNKGWAVAVGRQGWGDTAPGGWCASCKRPAPPWAQTRRTRESPQQPSDTFLFSYLSGIPPFPCSPG